MKRTIALTLATALFAAPALAFDDTDSAAITETFDTLLSDLDTGNYEGVFDVMPPAFLENLAQQSGMTADQLKEAGIQQMEQSMGQVEIEEASYDMAAAETGTSDTGRDYAMIPTTTVMKVGEQRMEATGGTLALEDGDQWYLVRLETPAHMQLVGQVYPDLANLTAPPSEMKQLD